MSHGGVIRPADLHRDGRWSWRCTQWRVIAFGALNPFGACHSLFSHRVGCCIVSCRCRWTHVLVFGGRFSFLFISLGPWLRATTLLWGGVVMRCIWGGTFISFFFGPYFAFFLGFGCFWVSWVFSATPRGVSQGLGTKPLASDVTMFLLERLPR